MRLNNLLIFLYNCLSHIPNTTRYLKQTTPVNSSLFSESSHFLFNLNYRPAKLFLARTKSNWSVHTSHVYAWGTLQGCWLIDVLTHPPKPSPPIGRSTLHLENGLVPPGTKNTSETSSVCVHLCIHWRPAAPQWNKCQPAPGEKVTALDSTTTGGKLQHLDLGWIERGWMKRWTAIRPTRCRGGGRVEEKEGKEKVVCLAENEWKWMKNKQILVC